MRFAVLDSVVLARDLPELGLRAGDLGAVVEVYAPDGIEVEFVRASGHTKALLTLTAADVRPVAESDLLAVRAGPNWPGWTPGKTALEELNVGFADRSSA
jgi:Domain of unknown function (DUF4926)